MSRRSLGVLLFISFGASYPHANGVKPDLPTNASAIMKATAFSPIRRKGSICLTCVKYIPPDGAGYLSFGGEVRERFEIYRNREFSSNPNADNAYLLQRYLFHADYDPVMPDFYPLPILCCAGRSSRCIENLRGNTGDGKITSD